MGTGGAYVNLGNKKAKAVRFRPSYLNLLFPFTPPQLFPIVY